MCLYLVQSLVFINQLITKCSLFENTIKNITGNNQYYNMVNIIGLLFYLVTKMMKK